MVKKYDPAVKEALLAKDRADALDTHRVMSFLPLMPYQEVADVGCGPGYFTIPLAKFAFDGKVFALDIHQEMLDAVREAADEVRLSNVETVLSKETKVALDKETIDGALVAFLLSDVAKPAKVLKDLHGTLRTGGWLGVVEETQANDNGADAEASLPEAAISELVLAAGFRFTGRYDISSSNYLLVFRA
jgi:ubiquinone/menaquinone biosynthesis C-methylase UbiE